MNLDGFTEHSVASSNLPLRSQNFSEGFPCHLVADDKKHFYLVFLSVSSSYKSMEFNLWGSNPSRNIRSEFIFVIFPVVSSTRSVGSEHNG